MKTTTRKRGNYVYTYEVLRYEYSPQLRHSVAILGKQVKRQPIGKSIINGMCRFCRKEHAIGERQRYGDYYREMRKLKQSIRSFNRRVREDYFLGLNQEDEYVDEEPALYYYTLAIGTGDERKWARANEREKRQNLTLARWVLHDLTLNSPEIERDLRECGIIKK